MAKAEEHAQQRVFASQGRASKELYKSSFNSLTALSCTSAHCHEASFLKSSVRGNATCAKWSAKVVSKS
jgi:hypothetical protein